MPIVILLCIGLFVLVFVLPIRAVIKAGEALLQSERLREQLARMQQRLEAVQERLLQLERGISRPVSAVESATAAEETPEPIEDEITAAQRRLEKVVEPLSLPEPEEPAAVPVAMTPPSPIATVGPPPLPPSAPSFPFEPAAAPKSMLPELNLEQFMGVKLFAWLGGLALFFGVAFFVKYSFEHNLIPPAMRVAIGFVVGAGLVVAGVVVHRRKAYTVLGQTFCASGALILYGVSFGAHALYHLFGEDPRGSFVAFSLMSLITAVAFLLAVRLDALVVAVLGMLGGFLTPILCSTGQDNPFGLFSYIALLDIGLLLVAKRRGWLFLSSLAAAGTILMQVAWFARFFQSGHYYEGTATLVPMGIVLFFIALFTTAAWRARAEAAVDLHPLGAALALCGFGLLTAFAFLGYDGITHRTFLLYGYTFAINLAALTIVFVSPRLSAVQVVVGLATFLHLGIWTTLELKPEMLGAALAVYLVFGILHAAFPIVWRRLRQDDLPVPRAFGPWFPPLVIALMLLPVLRLDQVSFVVWPAILLADICVFAVALLSGALVTVVAALVLTLTVILAWLFRVPPEVTSLPSFLFVLGGFAAVFAMAGCWLAKRFTGGLRQAGEAKDMDGRIAASLPVLSAALPFLLLIMATLRLPVSNPSPVFGLGLLLVLLLLGLARIVRIPALPLASLACMVALEGAWHSAHFDADQPWIPLGWYVGIHLLFTVYPFVFRDSFRQMALPWAASAASGIGHFVLVYLLAKASFPGMADRLGLLPALFALPGIAGLLAVLRLVKPEGAARHAQLAWFGGVALLFITLIFPIQFDKHWLTISWALEGAALIWLFRRVPHRGLVGTGLALLAVAFARLVLNPAVLSYYPRGETAILNWHLYTYGIAAVSMMLGARWLMAPDDRLGGINVRGVLHSLGGILVFALLNIEIADFFTEPGSRFITLSFGGANFARDMTYSMAWGLFALAVLIIGFASNTKGARYAGIGLLALTLLKVFLHDLASLPSIYRIAALMVVAVVALVASFLYQRFFDRAETK